MSLQFIIGSSGIGKTHYACQRIIQESGKAVLYYCAGAVYHADPEERGRNASGKRNPEY